MGHSKIDSTAKLERWSTLKIITRRRGKLRVSPIVKKGSKQFMPEEESDARWAHELCPPDGYDGAEATEIIRTWIIDGSLAVSMRMEVIQHPVQWGAILADLARWVTLIFDDGSHKKRSEKIMDEVVKGFRLRLENPEDTSVEAEELPIDE